MRGTGPRHSILASGRVHPPAAPGRLWSNYGFGTHSHSFDRGRLWLFRTLHLVLASALETQGDLMGANTGAVLLGSLVTILACVAIFLASLHLW